MNTLLRSEIIYLIFKGVYKSFKAIRIISNFRTLIFWFNFNYFSQNVIYYVIDKSGLKLNN